MSAIAIIGMACRYPGARSPRQLWENALAQRRSFRRIPRVRLSLDDYSFDGPMSDGIYLKTAAVLEDYEFDRVRFQISKEALTSTDLTHWLALDTAWQALKDAKLLDASESQRERTGVYVGNSLTGEFSRANLLRLRWPYVRRVLTTALAKHAAYQNGDLHKLIAEIEALYKAPFPSTTEESLAGGLSNTIAGRICNYFNLKGGGYTVDGACASSLLAVTTACSALESGDVDIAIAGGVDLSLDPFELAGFSKLGALAKDNMRIFDVHSSGFWPGEGCGMLVLMRREDADARHHSSYAVLRGWGVSSDGSGGITRPEPAGQLLALRRAYQRAGYGIDSVSYLEGHGTGTSVGDAAELQALSAARREARAGAPPAALGSIKANIGHTKAAAGVAGLIKATLAVQTRILPPTTGCDTPHGELTKEKPALRVLKEGELWPGGAPYRAGVNAMGFGGINTHVTLEAVDAVRRRSFNGAERQQLSSAQDCELFLFQAANNSELASQLEEILEHAGEISFAEMTDLAAFLAHQIAQAPAESRIRAACVASNPEELQRNLGRLLECCAAETKQHFDSSQGVILSVSLLKPRIGFLFSGQGSPVYSNGGIWSRRFAAVRDLYHASNLPSIPSIATEVAQPCVVTASLAGLYALDLCGIEADLAIGHSLGELTAMFWAGACEQQDLLRIVRERGRIMAEKATPFGSMASIGADGDEIEKRIAGDSLVIAAYNSRSQTVVAGDTRAVQQFTACLGRDGISATILPVSHAFHSPLMANVAGAFHDYLSGERFGRLHRKVFSTVTGSILEGNANLRELLTHQITMSVQFARAFAGASAEADLFIEVGPGAVLSGIASECTDKPVIALEIGGESLRGLCLAVGASFALSANVCTSALFESRFVRPFDLKRRHTFLQNPCETIFDSVPEAHSAPVTVEPAGTVSDGADAMQVLRNLISQRTELPLGAIQPESRFLDDLHLNSITTSQIILQTAAQLNLAAPPVPTEYTNATIAQAAQMLRAIDRAAPARLAERFPQGIDSWIRVLAVEYVEQELRSPVPPGHGTWQLLARQEQSLPARLQQRFSEVSGHGVVCLVPSDRDQETAACLLEWTQQALAQNVTHVVFAGGGAAALARTLYLERPSLTVTVVDVPLDHPKAAEWIVQEARSASGFTEARYDSAGFRREPRLKVLWPDESTPEVQIGPDDVLLATGGGKGITAECAFELARESKCSLALVGRSDPEHDEQLKANLLRFTRSGISFRYFCGDVSDPHAAATVIREITAALGSITVILHGAGINIPARIEEITPATLRDTLAPKLDGLRNILNGINPEKLHLLVSFGSMIARSGLWGEAHYALANDWLRAVVEHWQEEHPACRCLNLEWSVWAGAGMGQHLGVLSSLMEQGIAPLPLDDAIAILKTMVAWKQAPVSSIVTNRFGDLPTLQFTGPELPLRRFLEHVEVYYPGIELIAAADLSVDTDPYLAEHVFAGEQLLPAVCGMEAMAQAAMALENPATEQLPQFHRLRLEHPIVVPADKREKIRIAALRRGPGRISVVIRCSSTSFQIDHFSAECVFDGVQGVEETALPFENASLTLPLDPERDLYGRILFHQGRFCRVKEYRWLQADRSLAELVAPTVSRWYARHLPASFAAGDPASRDAALHSIQACIPHKTILPVGVERIIAAANWTFDRATVHAIERVRDGNNFLYDLKIQNAAGQTCESWEGLHLRAVSTTETRCSWPLPLLGPYLERKLGELVSGGGLKVMLGGLENNGHSMEELLRVRISPHARVVHRPDGKPELPGVPNVRVSLSHTDRLTLIFCGNDAVGCDVQQITSRETGMWEELLGRQGFDLAEHIVKQCNIALDRAATQVWTLKEALRKSGASFSQPLRLVSATPDDWGFFSAGGFSAATFHTIIEDLDAAFAFAFVRRNEQ
jgi:enediyne polyketide synthase